MLRGYRRRMPAWKRPSAQAAAIVRQILLDGVANEVDVVEILGQLAPLHPRNDTFPGEILLRLGADALDWAGVDRAGVDRANRSISRGCLSGSCPRSTFAGRDRRKLQFAVRAAAAQRGGVEVDLLDEVAWRQSADFWRFAAHAAVAYIRAVAYRAGVPASEVCHGFTQEQPPSPG
jgi:hypothetical protein